MITIQCSRKHPLLTHFDHFLITCLFAIKFKLESRPVVVMCVKKVKNHAY